MPIACRTAAFALALSLMSLFGLFAQASLMRVDSFHRCLAVARRSDKAKARFSSRTAIQIHCVRVRRSVRPSIGQILGMAKVWWERGVCCHDCHEYPSGLGQ